MHRRALSLIALLLIVSMPLAASQFVVQSFDKVAREATYAVRGSIVDTWSAWNDAHDLIYTYATVRVTRYFGENAGPDLLLVREVGGTVDGYTQEAIGFPAIRRGEQVVLFLSEWENGDYRIHAFNQGKYLVRMRPSDHMEVLVSDPVKQGEGRLATTDRHELSTDALDAENGLTLDEFAGMVDAARTGLPTAQHRQ
jgi:hypothetical protein